MFPQSLHKNIRELDKQITLLESECENMSTDKRKNGFNGKMYFSKKSLPCSKKNVPNENLERPFYTAPRLQETALVKKPSKNMSAPTRCPKSASAVGKIKKTATSTTNNEPNRAIKSCPISRNGRPQSGNKKTATTLDCTCNKKDSNEIANDKYYDSESDKQVLHKGVLHANPGGTIEVTVVQKSAKTPRNTTKEQRKSVHERNVASGEKSDSDSCNFMKDNQKISSNSQKWCEILCQGNDNDSDKNNKINHLSNNHIRSSYSLGTKYLSHFDAEPKKYSSVGDTHLHDPSVKLNKSNKELVQENTHSQSTAPNDQRIPRAKSPFKKKKVENVIDASPRTAGYYEKGIQCGGDERSYFSDESFDPLRTMCHLIEALKGNFTEEDAKKLVGQLETSLVKFVDDSQSKSSGKEKVYYNFESQKQENEYVKKLQKHFLTTKKQCDELMKEKNKLSEDLAVKEKLLETMIAKEKEYLSAITNLKVSVEKKKILADENLEAMKELNIVKTKLMNETKVAEALRKSHGKLQEQIQKCMLENDKLKTEIRLNKLESQKFCFLIAGKDAEIKRYKDEIESFQRHITEQLVALRSNKAAQEVQKAMEAVMKQSQAFSVTDWDSAFSETQSDKGERTSSKQREKLMHSSPTSTKSSIDDSSWNHISSIHGEESKSVGDEGAEEEEEEEVFIGDLRPVGERSIEDEPKLQSFISCKSIDDITQINEVECKELVNGESNNRLRKNIEELFQELKVKCSQKMFSVASDSIMFEDLFNSSGTSDMSEMSASFFAAPEKNGRN